MMQAIPLPKMTVFSKIATDGHQMYNGSAFAVRVGGDGDLYIVLSGQQCGAVMVVLSFEDLRRLIELTEK